MELEECLSILSNSETSSTIPTALVCLVDALTIQKDDFIHRILSWSQSNKVLQTLLDILSWKETRQVKKRPLSSIFEAESPQGERERLLCDRISTRDRIGPASTPSPARTSSSVRKSNSRESRIASHRRVARRRRSSYERSRNYRHTRKAKRRS